MDELYIKLRKHVYERLDIGRDVADSELYEVIDACIYDESRNNVISIRQKEELKQRIRMGAVCVTQVEDILDEMGINRAESKAFNKNLLAPAEKKVYSCVRLESRHIDDICFETGISVSEVTQILYELEQKRLIKQLVRNYYVRA